MGAGQSGIAGFCSAGSFRNATSPFKSLANAVGRARRRGAVRTSGSYTYTEFWTGSASAVSQYAAIDPLLSKWALAHSLIWLTDYQDYAVRTLFLNPDRRDRIQIWVDPPHDGSVIVGVGQNRKGLSRLNRVEKAAYSIADLPHALDNALHVAEHWLAKDAE